MSTRSDFSALSAAVIVLSQAEHDETKHLFVLEGVSPGGNNKTVLPVLQVTSSSAARHLRHHRLSVAKPPLHFLFFRGVQHLRIEAPEDPIIGYQYIITALSGNRIPDWLNNFATLWLQHPSKTSGFEPPQNALTASGTSSQPFCKRIRECIVSFRKYCVRARAVNTSRSSHHVAQSCAVRGTRRSLQDQPVAAQRIKAR